MTTQPSLGPPAGPRRDDVAGPGPIEPEGPSSSDGDADGRRGPTARRVALAALIGTTIEWYDFFIYGTAAAIVFAPQFFPTVSPVAGTLAAFSTFAVGFLARPVGGAVMGHLGDRWGRKRMLIASLIIMGAATMGVGLLPNYAAIGVAAPILLVLLRFVQGLGVGGEWGGAVLMSLEHAPRSRRTLYGSFPQAGLPAGVVLASMAFLVVQLSMDQVSFLAWGWRIPFLLSVLLIGFGLLLRRRLTESPEFTRARSRDEVTRRPLVEVVRDHWRALVLATAISILFSGIGNLLLVFSLSYVATRKLLAGPVMLAIILVGAAVMAATIPIGAMLAERVGRRRSVLGALVVLTVWAFPYFWLLDTGSVPLIVLASVVVGAASGLGLGPYAAFVAEAFPVAVRYSGASVAYALGGVLGGGLVPIVGTALVASTGGSLAVSLYVVLMGVVSIVGTARLRSPV